MYCRSTPSCTPCFSTQRSGHLPALDIQTTPDIGQSNAPRPTFPRPLAPEISPALWVKVYCMYTHTSGAFSQNRYKSTSNACGIHFRHRLSHYNKSHLAMTSGSEDITCMAYGKDSWYSTSAYHVPPAGSFSPARARILDRTCSIDA